jgi:hypothetical protein
LKPESKLVVEMKMKMMMKMILKVIVENFFVVDWYISLVDKMKIHFENFH